MLTANKALPEEMNCLGERLLEASQIQDAQILFELATSHDPDNGQYANNLAISRFQSGDLYGAISDLETAINKGGNRRLFTLNYADLAQTRPQLFRRGLEVCQGYLKDCGEDQEILASANRLKNEMEAVSRDFLQDLGTMPHHAKLKVNGAAEPEHLVQMGENLAECIMENLDGMAAARTVLDFGVGLGRVLWPLSQKAPRAQFIGFDVDPIMLNSLANVRAVAGTELVSTTRDIPDNSVDVAYVISVFTHLDHTTDYWLYELNRVLVPGGQAFVTYHDKTLFEEMRKKLGGTPSFTGRTTVGSATEGSTNLGTYYETPEWDRTVGRFFNIIRTVPRGLNGHQSFSVLEKGDVKVDPLDLHRTYIQDLETELFNLRNEAKLEI